MKTIVKESQKGVKMLHFTYLTFTLGAIHFHKLLQNLKSTAEVKYIFISEFRYNSIELVHF